MALVVKDRVKETTATTGTGTLTLAGAVAGFQTFTSVLSNGDTTYYGIFESSTGEFEVGLGTFTSSGTTLARTTILESSNSGSAINLTAGAADVFITQPAEKAVYLDGSGYIATADGRNLTNVDAATVDSLDSTQFLRSDAADTKTSGDLTFSDSVKAIFGAGSDLSIFHDGSNSYISDQGTGGLKVLNDSWFYINNAADTANKAIFKTGAEVELYYNGNLKFETTNTGIDVTGTVTADSLTVDDITINGSTISDAGDLTIDVGGDIILDADGDEIFFKDGATNIGKINLTSDNFTLKSLVSDKDIVFQGNDGGSGITALTLDMSAAGAATFNAGATFGGTVTADGLTVDTNTLHVDATNNRVGIGTTSPATPFTLEAAGSSSAGENTHLRINDTTNMAAGVGGVIQLSGEADSGGTTQYTFATIKGIKENGTTGNYDGALTFATRANGVSPASEAMRIDSSGSLLHGTTNASIGSSSTEDGIVLNATGTIAATRGGNIAAVFNRRTDDGAIVHFRKDGSTVGSIGTGAVGGTLYIEGDSVGSGLQFGNANIYPRDAGALSDNAIDLGQSSYRFKDGYFSANLYANALIHDGDTNTYIGFRTDAIDLYTGGTQAAFSSSGLFITDGSVAEDYDALSGTTPTCNVDNGAMFSLTMTGNTTFTFSGAASGYIQGFVLQLTGNGSTVTWPTSVDWAGGTAPDAPASGETDILVFISRDGGTTWYGALAIDAAA